MKQKDPLRPTGDSMVAGQEEESGKEAKIGSPPVNGQMPPLSDKDLELAKWVRRMPDLDPPPTLLASVMRSIQPKRLPWTRRVLLWARSPKSFTFTPVRFAPAAMAIIAILAVTGYWTFGQKDPGSNVSQTKRDVPVVFNLTVPEAHAVSVIGTFNGWKPKGYEMEFNPEKRIWSLTVRLPEGRYEYAFLVDGEKVVADPGADLRQDDGFGNENSVMILRAKNERTT